MNGHLSFPPKTAARSKISDSPNRINIVRADARSGELGCLEKQTAGVGVDAERSLRRLAIVGSVRATGLAGRSLWLRLRKGIVGTTPLPLRGSGIVPPARRD